MVTKYDFDGENRFVKCDTTPLGQELIQSATEALVNKTWNDAIEAAWINLRDDFCNKEWNNHPVDGDEFLDAIKLSLYALKR